MTKPEWPMRGLLDMSTSHISPESDELLKDWDRQETEYALHDPAYGANPVAMAPIRIARYATGWFLAVPEEDNQAEATESIQAIWTFARNQGADYILLDADGEIHDGLPVYEW